jgi:outer membrane protein assembly factor BamB
MPLPPGTENPADYDLDENQAERVWTKYRLTPAQLRTQDEELQKRILRGIQFEDLPSRRAEYFSLAHRGDEGGIPDDAYSNARAQLMQTRARVSAARGLVGGLSVGPMPLPSAPVIEAPTAGIGPDNTGWKSIGPGNIGGRIRSILIDPANPQKIYVGSVGGGVWITSDGGQSWQPGDDLMANLAVCCMAMHPTNSSTIYAGTGEGFRNDDIADFIRGDGIFMTNDSWVWTQLASTKDNPDFRWVNGLTINNDATAILAGTKTGIFRSPDGGVSWSKVLSGAVGNILFNPGDKTKVIAGLLFGGGIRYSTTGGLSWNTSTKPAGSSGVGRSQVCYAAANPNIVYASVETSAGASEIWRSNDGGRTFAKRNATSGGVPVNFLASDGRNQGYYDNIIWAGDPTNSDFLIVGGVDLFKSTDGGNTLTQISDWRKAPPSPHADHHAIVAAPGYNGTTNKSVYFGNDGSLYTTSDVTTAGTNATHTNGWRFLGSRLPITQFYSGVADPTTKTVIGGAQDNGTLRYTSAAGANNWNTVFGGDGGYVASDPTNTNNFFGEYVYLGIFRNTDGGATSIKSEYISGQYWNGANWVWKPAPYSIPDAQSSSTALFIAPMVLDPNDANRLLGGGRSLWLTTNPLAANSPTSGPTWTGIKSPVGGALISAIAVAPGNSDIVLVGYDNGRIDKTTNATASMPTWTRIDTNGIGASRLCTWLAIDANDNQRLYATFGGFQGNNVWTSPDGGTHWTNIAGGLPAAPVRCVTIHPQNSQWIYVGTEVGVFSSEDRGLNWSPANEGPTNCVIYQLFWLNNMLYCASHGRGMFSIDLTIQQQASLVVTADLNGNLTAFNGQGGATVSTYRMAAGQITAAPLSDGSTVYCGYALPFTVAKFADANNLGAGPVWQASLHGAINATPDLVKAIYQGDKDLVYAMAADGKLYVLDAADGSQQWTLQVVPAGLVSSGVKAFSNRVMNQWVYIGTDQGFYAVNTQTRTVGWSKNVVCQVAPLIAANLVFVPTQNGKIYALEARTGTEKWNYDTGGVVASTPVWVLGSIIAGNQTGTLVGLDYRTGSLQFSASFAGEQIDGITADGTELYFVGNAANGHLYAYQLNITGATRSISQTWCVGLNVGVSHLPPVVGTSLYATTTDANLIAFNTGNGSRIWANALAAKAMGAPALLYA